MQVIRSGSGRWYSRAAHSLLGPGLPDDPVEAMEARAAQLVAAAQVRKPPVDLARVALLQGVVAVREDDIQDAGLLVPRDDGLLILLKRSDPRARKNFSCAHEIAHTVIPAFWGGPPDRHDPSTGEFERDQEEEYLCDVGAAAILLPDQLFQPEAGGRRLSLRTLRELARVFDASLEATGLKMVGCGVWTCGFIVWEMMLKPRQSRVLDHPVLPGMADVPGPEEKLRIKFAVCSRDRWYFPRMKSAEDDSLVRRCYEEDRFVEGWTHLPVRNVLKPFLIEAMPVKYRVGGQTRRKVLCLVKAAR